MKMSHFINAVFMRQPVERREPDETTLAIRAAKTRQEVATNRLFDTIEEMLKQNDGLRKDGNAQVH